jgi:hypothetical protein
MSSSADGISGWSRWQLLSFDAPPAAPAPGPSTNIYFFNVHALGPTRLLAIFPAAFPASTPAPADFAAFTPSATTPASASVTAPTAAPDPVSTPAPASAPLHGGVFTASSTDGVRWSTPRLILPSTVRAAIARRSSHAPTSLCSS